MLIIVLILEAIILSWTARLIKKSSPFPGQSERSFYWSTVRRMSWRLLILAVFPLPEIIVAVGIFGDSPEATTQLAVTAAMIPILLSPLFILSIMWRARKLVQQRFTEAVSPTRTIARILLDERSTPPPPPPPPTQDLSTRFFLHIGSEAKGPFTMEQIHGIISVGTASLTTQCCKEGSQEWRPVSAFV